MEYRQISRGFSLHYFFLSNISKHSQALLGGLLSILPAFFYGCNGGVEKFPPPAPAFMTKVSSSFITPRMHTLDIFVFKDDALQRLDCYQRFEEPDDWKGMVTSSGGKRIITALANSPYEREFWFPMNSRAFLKDIHISLEDECREYPTMYGEQSTDTREGNAVGDFQLRPFVSEIHLNSLCCDFTGRAYEGERLSRVKVYLTNVNAECRILDNETSPPLRIINAGGLHEEEVENFRTSDLLVQEIPGEIGRFPIHPDIRLWCYRNNQPQEGPGTPFTRLVIEGDISGQTFYWPIDINRNTKEESGIWRGRCYSYDIKITRKGTSDPDIPVCPTDITINQEVAEWKEKEDYPVIF